MNQLRELLNQHKDIPLSDADIRQLMKESGIHANVVSYGEIKQYPDIDKLLGPDGCCFILYEWRKGYGHWCLLTKRGNEIEFMDPYGEFVDTQLEYVPEELRAELGEDHKYLSDLLRKCDYELAYNEFEFQSLNEESRTCGRWTIIRAKLKDMSLEDFRDIFLNVYGDEIATILTS